MENPAERSVAGLTIRIDRGRCIGTANCIKVAPGVFALDNGNVVSFTPASAAIDQARLIDACSVCPVDALSAIDANGHTLVP